MPSTTVYGTSSVQQKLCDFIRPIQHYYPFRNLAKPATPFPLLYLPAEMIYEVFIFLDHEELSHCRQACRYLRSLIDRSVRLKLPLLYRRYNLIRPANTQYRDSACETKRLIQFDKNWCKLKHGVSYHSVVRGCLSPDYALIQDVFMVLHNEPGPIQTITLLNTPNNEGRPCMNQWSLKFRVPEDGVLMGATADPSQNLLVTVVYTGDPNASTIPTGALYSIRFFKLSDRSPHPEATHHSVSLARSSLYGAPGSEDPAFQLHIRESVVLIHTKDTVTDVTSSISMWNWKIGYSTFHKQRLPTDRGAYEIAFIAARHFILFDSKRATIDLYSINKPDLLSMTSGPQCYASFSLPELDRSYTYRCTYLAPNGASESTESRPEPWDAPFRACPDRGVFVIGLCAYRYRRPIQLDSHCFDVVVMIEPLLKLAERVIQMPTCSKPACRRDRGLYHVHAETWKEWGPKCARIIEHEICDSPWGSVYGYRVIKSYNIGHQPKRSRMHILDFNPHTVNETDGVPRLMTTLPPVDRNGRPEVPPGQNHRVVQTAYVQAAYSDHVFAEEVYCPIPYRETYRAAKVKLYNAFLGPNGVIATAQAKDKPNDLDLEELAVIANAM